MYGVSVRHAGGRCHHIHGGKRRPDGRRELFYPEIRYLKRILDSLSDDRVTICAIDEILRGTNTGERIRASRAILELPQG